MILIIDNYDSFTHNLARYFEELGCVVEVVRNDALTIQDIEAKNPHLLVLSPGPCTPNEAGITLEAIRYFKEKLPLLGVCLGHQAIAQSFGATIKRAGQIMHGKVSDLMHFKNKMFAGIPETFQVTRYHSLVIDPLSLPDCLHVTAKVEDEQGSEIMAIAHKELPIWGVQFHPESHTTEYGHQILTNILNNIE